MSDPGADSPCIKVCVLDASGQLCTGCFRTLEEIGRWGGLTPAERAGVLAKLPARRAGFAASAPAEWERLRCARCGAPFACGAKDEASPCWCTRYPPVAPAGENATCLCPGCLAAAGTGD